MFKRANYNVVSLNCESFPMKCGLVDGSINPQAYYNERFSTNNDITLRDHWSGTGVIPTQWSVTVMSQNIFETF